MVLGTRLKLSIIALCVLGDHHRHYHGNVSGELDTTTHPWKAVKYMHFLTVMWQAIGLSRSDTHVVKLARHLKM